MTSKNTISKSEFARRVGVSAARVGQLVKIGLPVEPDGKIHEAKARRWVESNLDQHRREARKPGSSDGAAAGTVTNLRAVKLARESQLLELELKRKQGSLVDRQAAEVAFFDRARLERDAWVGWSARAAQQIASACGGDPIQAHMALDRAVRQHLDELSKTPMTKLGADDA